MTYPVQNISLPAEFAVSVTPSDSTDLLVPCRGIYIGGAGAVTVNMMDGTQITFSGLAAGQFMPIRARRIWATGTTATGIVALY